jgi:rubrerythrin
MGNTESTPDEPLVVAWYCMICGEVTLAAERPSDCPFCGSAGEFLVIDMPPEHDVVPSELRPVEMEMLETSIRMEIADRDKYLALSQKADTVLARATWKRLSRIEAEHATVFAELGRKGAMPQPGRVEAIGTPDDEIAKAQRGEAAASADYAEFAARAAHPRLKMVWTALAAVEAGHYSLMGGQ